MKRGKQIDAWYPFYIDKWLFGSTRHELVINAGWAERFPDLVALVPESIMAKPFTDLRGIFVDLMSLSKKDSGFIRANETTPYPHEQLAGMFCVPVDHIKASINICLHPKVGKLEETSPGIYYLRSTETYSLTDRYKRRMVPEGHECSGKEEQGTETPVPRLDKKREEESRGNKNKGESEFARLFDLFWEGYPKKVAKDYAREKFMILARAGKMDDLKKAANGYLDFLKSQRLKRNFDQEPMNPATFLSKNRWEDYISFVFKPSL